MPTSSMHAATAVNKVQSARDDASHDDLEHDPAVFIQSEIDQGHDDDLDSRAGDHDDTARVKKSSNSQLHDTQSKDDRSALRAWLQRRTVVAQAIKHDREQRVRHLHETKSRHYVDHCFSFVMGNLAVVSLVLGALYSSRTCAKPLAAFLVILGCLAPFAACVPILVRQWLYLHLRCNAVACGVFFMALLHLTWLFVGQQWAFASSAANCDDELSAAANAVVFVVFLTTLVYAAKVAWYLLLRVRYSHRTLWRSCWRDPYPDALTVSEDDFLALEAIVVSSDAAAVGAESSKTAAVRSTHSVRDY